MESIRWPTPSNCNKELSYGSYDRDERLLEQTVETSPSEKYQCRLMFFAIFGYYKVNLWLFGTVGNLFCRGENESSVAVAAVVVLRFSLDVGIVSSGECGVGIFFGDSD